jgi:hypothetical protein
MVATGASVTASVVLLASVVAAAVDPALEALDVSMPVLASADTAVAAEMAELDSVAVVVAADEDSVLAVVEVAAELVDSEAALDVAAMEEPIDAVVSTDSLASPATLAAVLDVVVAVVAAAAAELVDVPPSSANSSAAGAITVVLREREAD